MFDWAKDLKLSKNELTVFFISFAVIIAAKGASLFPLSYSIDCYSGMLQPAKLSQNYDGMIAQGRFVQALMSKIMYYVGASAPLTNIFYILIYMLCTILISLIVCRIWKIADNITLSCLVVLFITMHPYQAELFTFKVTPLYTSVSLALAFFAVYFINVKIKTIIMSSTMLMLSLGIYQLVLNYIFITICIALVLEILKQVRLNNSVDWRQVLDETKTIPRLVTICIGVFLYLLVNKLVIKLLSISQTKRSLFISTNEISARLSEIYLTIKKMFFETEPVSPASLKNILIIIFVLSIVLISKQFILSKDNHRIIKLFSVLLIILFAAIGIMGVIIPVQNWWAVPRVLSGASFFWAGIVALAYLGAENAKAKIIIISLCCIVLFGFIGINNHIFTDQLRVNMRDFHKANRIVAMIESAPGFTQVKRIKVVGTVWGYPSPIYTAQGDMNISAFGSNWSSVNILKEVSGYNFADATAEDLKIAEEYCMQSPKWPAPNSVKIMNELAIVCQNDIKPPLDEVINCEIIDILPKNISKPLKINYSNKINLVGVTLKNLSKNELLISYFWQPLEKRGNYNQILVHFTDKNKKTLFQGDHNFCKDVSFDAMKGKYVKETYKVSVPQPALDKDIYLKIGVFSPDDKGWPRLKIEASNGIETEEGNTEAVVEKINF